MRKVSWFVKAVAVNSNQSVAAQLSRYIKGQWVIINGMMARIVQVVNGRAVLWMKSDKMVAVFA